MRPTPDHRSTRVILLVVTAIVAVLAACTTSSGGTPIAKSGQTAPDIPSSTSTSGGSQQRSLKELDMCKVLTSADMPVQPGNGGIAEQKPEFNGDLCSTIVQLKDIVSVLVASVERKPRPFSQFIPPSGSPNGRMTEIAGRKAWVGNPFSDVDRGCFAAFGAADGYISIAVTDDTKRGVDPCQTVIQLAEKVIGRTPAPRE